MHDQDDRDRSRRLLFPPRLREVPKGPSFSSLPRKYCIEMLTRLQEGDSLRSLEPVALQARRFGLGPGQIQPLDFFREGRIAGRGREQHIDHADELGLARARAAGHEARGGCVFMVRDPYGKPKYFDLPGDDEDARSAALKYLTRWVRYLTPADQVRLPNAPGEPSFARQVSTTEDEGPIGPREKALALLVADSSLSVAQIAARVGVHRSTPYRWPLFRRAWDAAHAPDRDLPAGAKHEGRVEAWEDESRA